VNVAAARTPGAAAALLAAALILLHFPVAAAPAPRSAIIMDDLGYQLAAGRRAVNLPGPVACAVLPGTPRAEMLADAAFARGKDVLLHLPLQSMGQSDAEPEGLLLDIGTHTAGD
jgi:hypothetical protein